MKIDDENIQRKTVRLNPEDMKSAVMMYLDSLNIVPSDEVSFKFFGSGECTVKIDYKAPS